MQLENLEHDNPCRIMLQHSLILMFFMLLY